MFSASGLCPWYLNNEVLCGRSVFCSGTTQLMRVSVFPKQLSLSNVWDWSSKDFFFYPSDSTVCSAMSLGRGSPVFAIVLCSRRGEQRCYPAVKVVSDPLLKRTGTITGRHCTAIPVFFLISAALCCFLISSLFRLR